MIEQATLLTYVAIVAGFAVMPGPATLLTMARASTSGPRVGIATAVGIAGGDLTHTLMAVVGISAVIAASATLFTMLKLLGAAYLVLLGIRALFSRPAETEPAAPMRLTAGAAMRQAMLAEVLNPKTAMFFLAFMPQFVDPAGGSPALQLTILGVLFVAIGLCATIGAALMAGWIGSVLRRSSRVARWQRRIVGSVYCGLGIRLALAER